MTGNWSLSHLGIAAKIHDENGDEAPHKFLSSMEIENKEFE